MQWQLEEEQKFQLKSKETSKFAPGYTSKTNPGPSVATSLMSCPDVCAMYPRTEKMTKPEIKLVAELMKLVRSASLEKMIDEVVWKF